MMDLRVTYSHYTGEPKKILRDTFAVSCVCLLCMHVLRVRAQE